MTPIWNWIWILIPLLLALLFEPWLNKNKKLPPGPKGFPILGSLHLIKKFPHRDLHTLSKKYGPIMHMKLGLVNTIVVSSPESAELFLKTYDHIFASRPLTSATNHLFYGQKNFGFAKYGPYWRNMRKMCTQELLSTQKVNSFKSMRKTEVESLVESLKEAAKSQTAVDLSLKVTCVVRDMICLMVFGKKNVGVDLDETSFHSAVQEVVKLVVAPNLGDFIPFVARLDLQGLNRRAIRASEVFDGFLERIVDEHLVSRNGTKSHDFVDVMLDLMEEDNNEYQIDRLNIKALILEMIIAAMDTTTTAIEWALPELIKHPQVMKKMQEELEKVVSLNRTVEESDLEHLEYFDMIVKETLRLHPPAPLSVPHESLEDCIVKDFHIPKQSRIIINAWAIGQDPNFWIDPEMFFPERFVGLQVDVKGKDFQLIPFGSGRRGCPGMQLGLTMVRLVLAQLVHCFDWKLPNNMLPIELDMTEDFGLTCPRLQHLMAIPIYRLSQ